MHQPIKRAPKHKRMCKGFVAQHLDFIGRLFVSEQALDYVGVDGLFCQWGMATFWWPLGLVWWEVEQRRKPRGLLRVEDIGGKEMNHILLAHIGNHAKPGTWTNRWA